MKNQLANADCFMLSLQNKKINNMNKNFLIKEGKLSLSFLTICLFFAIAAAIHTQAYAALSPILFLLSAASLVCLIMRFRWMLSFAVFFDTEKREVILNHTLLFWKKRISLDDITTVDTEKGNLILSRNAPLSKWQKRMCKTLDSYTICFDSIEACERRQFIDFIADLKDKTT